jgi:hypothetical protein
LGLTVEWNCGLRKLLRDRGCDWTGEFDLRSEKLGEQLGQSPPVWPERASASGDYVSGCRRVAKSRWKSSVGTSTPVANDGIVCMN